MNDKIITTAQLEEFRRFLIEDEKSPATIAKYCRDVEAFLLFTGGGEVTKETVLRYRQHLIEKYAPASVNSMLIALNRFLQKIDRSDCVVKTLKNPRQSFQGKDRELTEEEYYRLLDAARKKNDTQLYMLMQTLCATSLRVSELRFITVETLQQGQATVSLWGKTRQVIIPKDLSRELTRYAKTQGIHTGSIFVTRGGLPMDRSNILHRMKSLCDDAQVLKEKVSPQKLQHLFVRLRYEVRSF